MFREPPDAWQYTWDSPAVQFDWRGPVSPYGLFLSLDLVRRILLTRNKPRVTLWLIAVQCFLFALRTLPPLAAEPVLASGAGAALEGLARMLRLEVTCMSPREVLGRGQWYRLGSAMLTHANDLHLLWNMLGLWGSGVVLEGRLGSVGFGLLALFLGLAADLLFCAAAWAASMVGYMEWMRQCPVGFSAVLFGLIVMLNLLGYARGWTTVMGVRVPNAYAHWVILLVTQITTPNASFLGHLCGILVGLFCVFVARLTRKSSHGGWTWTWLRGRGYEDFGSGTAGGTTPEAPTTEAPTPEARPHAD